MTNVYFISGMGASCNVFNGLTLPNNYEKKYLEWRLPVKGESLEDYAKSYALQVNTSEPFILVGYSFGGILVQETNKFIQPEKTILIASIRDYSQRPLHFSFFQKIHIEQAIRSWFFREKMITWVFRNFVYKAKEPFQIKDFLPQLNVVYMRWAVKEILQWRPKSNIDSLYQIHGTKDVTFPFKRIKKFMGDNEENLYVVKHTGHLLVMEKPKEVSACLEKILATTKLETATY